MRFPFRPSQVILALVCMNIGLGFIVLMRLLLTDLETQTMQATEEMMVDVSSRLAQQVEHQLVEGGELNEELCKGIFPSVAPSLNTEVKIYDLEKRKVGLNHYITGSDGVVIFDSDGGRMKGEDHSALHNILKTLRGSYGARSTRLDEQDECSSIMYVGAPISIDGEVIGVLTAYKAQRDVMPFVLDRRKQIITVCILMACGIIVLVAGVFFWVYRPIGKLTDYAQAVIGGERPAFPKLGKGREINTLGSALRAMREALEGRAYAKNYVQTLSHELKSPISAIKASAELLEEDLPTEQRNKFLKTITSEVDRSEKVISRLQQLSLMEGMSELERKEEISLDTLMKELLREYQSVADAREIRLSAAIDSVSFLGDSFLLRAAFQNLLENAIKFSPNKGEVSITLESHEDKVVLEVCNEGQAIPDYARSRVFERLYSLSTTDQGKGSGIGLALVKEAVELHSGKVSYLLKNDNENCFRMLLPVG